MTSAPPFRVWRDPSPNDVATTLDGFLDQLGGPTWIVQPGFDRSRCRMLSTLLHGNEPSGVRALHRWLRSGERPAVDLVAFVGAVRAARAEPRFSSRMLDGARDLNRCFAGDPERDDEARLAAAVLREIRARLPECLLDVHNTSGVGPAYGVVTRLSGAHRAIASLFAECAILTDLRLGTLIEAVEDELPAVVVECGGSADAGAHRVAEAGLRRYAGAPDVLTAGVRASQLSILEHPIRVELTRGHDVVYAPERVAGAAITLRPDVDRHNFGIIPASTPIGWIGPQGLAALRAVCREGHERADALFRVDGDTLRLRRDLRLFMITTRPDIAKSDCLFYALPVGQLPARDGAPAPA